MLTAVPHEATDFLTIPPTPKIYPLSLHDALPIYANIVPYQTFQTKDGDIVIAVGNDRQFRTLCHMIGKKELRSEEHTSEVQSRDHLVCRLLLVKKQILLLA